MQKTEVLIIGAGPSGMVSALCLAKLGMSSIVVERNAGINLHPKAHELNARSIEILAELGITDEALTKEAAPFSDGARILFCKTVNEEYGRIDLYANQERRQKYEQHLKSPTPYLNISQTALEKILLQRIKANPLINLYFRQQWESLTQDENGVDSTVMDLEKETTFTIQSKYVLAADGAGSPCRKFLNIPVEGTEKIQDFVSAYFEKDLRSHLKTPAKLYWVLNPKAGGTFIAHHIEKRWVYMLPIYLDYEKKEQFTKAFFQDRIKKSLGDESISIDIKSISFWRMSAQLAQNFRQNRVFLIGDAAHCFPPTGGLGMNTGIADAHNIGWKLTAVLEGIADEKLLDTYESERLPIARQNTEESVFNYHKILEVIEAFGLERDGLEKIAKFKQTIPIKWLPRAWQDKILDWGTTRVAKKMDKFHTSPKLKEKVLATIANQVAHFDRIGLDIGYTYEEGAIISDGTDLVTPNNRVTEYIPSARPGARFPHIDFQEDDFSSHDLLDYKRFTLLVSEEGHHWEEAIKELPENLQEKLYLIRLDELELSEKVFTDIITLCEIEPTGAILVRPDGHVAWRLKQLSTAALPMLLNVFQRLLQTNSVYEKRVVG